MDIETSSCRILTRSIYFSDPEAIKISVEQSDFICQSGISFNAS